MSEKTLEIFELCERLANLLGDREAIADIKKLHEVHPEMFKNVEEVSKVIKEVVSEPEIIINNPRARSNKDFIAIKHLENNQNKIGDVGIRNDRGVNVVFHTNTSANRNFARLAKNKQAVTGGAVHSLHTSRPAELGGNNQKLSGANAHSATTSSSLPQQSQNVNNNPSQDKPLTKEEFMQQEQQKMASAKKAKETKKKDEELEI